MASESPAAPTLDPPTPTSGNPPASPTPDKQAGVERHEQWEWEQLDRNLTKKREGLRLAHTAMMIDDAQGVLKNNRENLAAHSQQHFGTSPTPEGDGSDMIHVGDINNYAPTDNSKQGGQTPAQKPAAQSTTAATPSPGLSNLAKAGILAATLATGGLGGAGLLSLLMPKPTPAATQPMPNIPDPNFYELRLVPNK